MSIRKLYLPFAIILLFGVSPALGQAAHSPFSSFGLGEQFGTALIPSQGMGGVGISNPEYWHLNSQNPALLIFNRFTTFQAGMLGEQRNQTSATTSEKSGSGNLAYLALGIPLKPGKWGTSVSLTPFTRLNYQLKYTSPIQGDPTNTVSITEEGTGGINAFGISTGVAITKKISVGVRANYLFSSIQNTFTSSLTATTQTLLIFPRIIERTYISDFQFTPAISFHKDSLFNKNYQFNIGFVYDVKANLHAKFHQTVERRNIGNLIDSTTLISNQPGIVTIPSSLSGGISFGRAYHWIAAIDGSYSDYSDYVDLSGTNPYQSKNWRVAAGYSFTPDPTSLSSYLRRATYRTGVSLENYPYLVNGNTVKDFGITFGLSLPVSRISRLDLALKVGKKGDKTLNTIEENYLKLYFGLTFNDQWFIKRRFD